MPLVGVDRTGAENPAAPPADGTIPHDEPSTPVVDLLVGSLIVVYAFDRGDHFRTVTRGDLAALGVDQHTLANAAVENLIDRLCDVQLLERPDGCGMVRLDGNLEASVLLVPQLWHDIAEILSDEVIIAVPSRDIVLFCGAGSESNRRALLSARDRALAVGNDTITRDLFSYQAGILQIEPA